jgi:hypothetical protein
MTSKRIIAWYLGVAWSVAYPYLCRLGLSYGQATHDSLSREDRSNEIDTRGEGKLDLTAIASREYLAPRDVHDVQLGDRLGHTQEVTREPYRRARGDGFILLEYAVTSIGLVVDTSDDCPI